MQDIGGAYGQLIGEYEALGFVVDILLVVCCIVLDSLVDEIVDERIDLFNILVERFVKAPRCGPDSAMSLDRFRLGSRKSCAKANV